MKHNLRIKIAVQSTNSPSFEHRNGAGCGSWQDDRVESVLDAAELGIDVDVGPALIIGPAPFVAVHLESGCKALSGARQGVQDSF